MNKTGARSTAREAALQLLYALEASGETEAHVLRTFWYETPGDPEGRPYAELFAAFSAPGPERIQPDPATRGVYAELGGRYADKIKAALG